MQPDRELEQFIFCSERTVLECECGEKLVLLGLEEDWYLQGRTAFECECGRELTLADSIYEDEPNPDGLDKDTLGVRELLRSLRVPGT